MVSQTAFVPVPRYPSQLGAVLHLHLGWHIWLAHRQRQHNHRFRLDSLVVSVDLGDGAFRRQALVFDVPVTCFWRLAAKAYTHRRQTRKNCRSQQQTFRVEQEMAKSPEQYMAAKHRFLDARHSEHFARHETNCERHRFGWHGSPTYGHGIDLAWKGFLSLPMPSQRFPRSLLHDIHDGVAFKEQGDLQEGLQDEKLPSGKRKGMGLPMAGLHGQP